MAVRNKAQFAARIASDFANNSSGEITEQVVRTFLTDLFDSLAFLTDVNTFSVTASTSDASGGEDGDVHLQYSGSNLASIWYRSGGTWNEYAVPASVGTAVSKVTNTEVDAVDSTDTSLSTDLSASNTEEDTKFLTIRKGLRLLQRVLKNASTTLRGVVLLARNEDVDATQTDTSRVPTVASTIRLLGRLAASPADVPEVWSGITNGAQIRLGKIVIHGGAYFGCITQHAKGSTGPDGDPTNWIILSNWGGAWSAKWYPVGTLVSHAGLPWVSTQAVINTDPAPNASTNTKWLALGATDPDVVIASSNTSIPSTANGDTYVHTGSSNITYTLPPASGGGAVGDGWQIVVTNQGAGNLTVDGAGADTVDGRATLVINTIGRSVKLQKVANGAWVSISDTKDETGGGGSTFTPSKANLYDAVKAIFSHNTAISPDDDNDELDVSVGAAAALADNSILPAKAQANTVAHKKDWRARLASSHISQVSAALPAAAGYNSGDLVIVARGGNTANTFIDVDDPSTQLTTTVAGDLIMLLSGRWSRLGNLFSGGIAAAAANATANANKVIVDNLHTFGEVVVTPPGIRDRLFPPFIAIALSEKLSPKTLTGIQVRLLGQVIGNVTGSANIAPFNGLTAGGIINCSLTTDQRTNLRDNAATANQWISGELRFTFDDGTSAINLWSFGTNNASFRPHTWREITAVAGASRTWTYQLSPADTDILVVLRYGGNNNVLGYHTGEFPRALFSAASQQFVVDSRVGSTNLPDQTTGGFTASISGTNVLNLSTAGWEQSSTPRVFAK